MNRPDLLDIAPVSAAEYAGIEDLCREVISTEQTTLVLQGEATVFLEAAARGLGRSGARALNLVSGPYGATFGAWLSEAGSEVEDLVVPFDRAVRPEQVEEALERGGGVDVVSVVHAEAATGVVNDLAAIARVARSQGALVVVDAVASVGAEPLAIDAWQVDLVVLSAQKALAGPSGVSVVTVSPGAWASLAARPSPWRGSVLSLLDWRDRWSGAGRSVLPVIPAHLETRALGAAMERVRAEGLDRVVARHRAASAATRAGLAPLGLEPWARQVAEAASVATLVRAPAEGARVLVSASLAAAEELAMPIGTAPGPLAADALRVNHTGKRATLTTVWSALAALARGLGSLGHEADLAAALAAATDTWYATIGVGAENGA
ncbi:MAG: aminotransferase class V-fold PLP-dependent enzyme [Acidimicrobiales bacterium]|jgi:aspartate aminotransferase-like enzyme